MQNALFAVAADDRVPDGVTAIVGNPPYEMDVFGRFLTQAHRTLPSLSQAGFLAPAYFFQTYGRGCAME